MTTTETHVVAVHPEVDAWVNSMAYQYEGLVQSFEHAQRRLARSPAMPPPGRDHGMASFSPPNNEQTGYSPKIRPRFPTPGLLIKYVWTPTHVTVIGIGIRGTSAVFEVER